MSGSYLGTLFPASFTEGILKFSYGGSMLGYTTGQIYGANTQLTIPTQANPNMYAVPAPDCLRPTDKSYSAFIYTPGNYGAGVAYNGKDYKTFVLGFPFESIEGTQQRNRIMKAILNLFKQ